MNNVDIDGVKVAALVCADTCKDLLLTAIQNSESAAVFIDLADPRFCKDVLIKLHQKNVLFFQKLLTDDVGQSEVVRAQALKSAINNAFMCDLFWDDLQNNKTFQDARKHSYEQSMDYSRHLNTLWMSFDRTMRSIHNDPQPFNKKWLLEDMSPFSIDKIQNEYERMLLIKRSQGVQYFIQNNKGVVPHKSMTPADYVQHMQPIIEENITKEYQSLMLLQNDTLEIAAPLDINAISDRRATPNVSSATRSP